MKQAARFRPKFLLYGCAALLLLVASCDACGDPTSAADECDDFDPFTGCLDEGAQSVGIELKNNSSQDVHLFLSDKGEDFPCCKVIPGDFHAATFNYKDGASVSVAAGRNGVILNTKVCKLSHSEWEDGLKEITWNNSWSC